MKAIITTLTPSFGERMQEYVQKTVAYNQLTQTDETPHKLVCEDHFTEALCEWWFEGKGSEIVKDLPSDLECAQTETGSYEATMIEDEVFIAYKGEITKADDILYVVKAELYGNKKEYDECKAHEKPEIDIVHISSLKELLEILFKR